MALTNAQYDALQRRYEERRLLHAEILRDRKEEVFEKIPEYARIDRQISAESMQYFNSRISGGSVSKDDLHQKIASLTQKKADLLKEAGFPSDYLEPIYDCPDCKDTGYIEDRQCHCFRQAAIDLLYYQTHLRDIFQQENFENFSLDYYSKDKIDPATKESSHENAKYILTYAHNFVNNFESDGGNIFLYGDTGMGKTYLSNCIAGALLNRGYSVIYVTAFELVDIFEKKMKDRSEENQFEFDHLFDADLLIIDDLGTEFVNSFTKSNLFEVINERLLHQKSTLISSNLSIREIKELYTERIASRIGDRYKVLRLFGDDIRAKKNM